MNALLLTALISACPQESPEGLSLRRERVELVRSHYQAADEERRQAALEVFKENRSAVNPEGKELDLSSLDLILGALKENGQIRKSILICLVHSPECINLILMHALGLLILTYEYAMFFTGGVIILTLILPACVVLVALIAFGLEAFE